MAATFLVGPFLPSDESSKDRDAVCFQNSTTEPEPESGSSPGEAAVAIHNEPWLGVAKIAWPFMITGVWCIVFSFGYAILGKSLFTSFFPENISE